MTQKLDARLKKLEEKSPRRAAMPGQGQKALLEMLKLTHERIRVSALSPQWLDRQSANVVFALASFGPFHLAQEVDDRLQGMTSGDDPGSKLARSLVELTQRTQES